MTRLVESWIRDIAGSIEEYSGYLKKTTGLDLSGLAVRISGLAQRDFSAALSMSQVAVVPITTGQGIIGTFSESVAAIAKCVGLQAFVTTGTDVAGIHEACAKGAGILFMADDDRFIALDVKRGRLAENSASTARGYTEALAAASGGLEGRRALVIGCGEVGMEMLAELKRKNALPAAYDIDPNRLKAAAAEGYPTINNTVEIKKFPLILDACPQGGWLTADMLADNAWIAAAGVPLSLDEDASAAFRLRLIHDYLPIGVAAMIGDLFRS